MQSKTALALFAAIACPLLFGCSSSGNGQAEPAASTHAALRRTQSCGDLTAALREDARSKLNRRVDAEVRAIREGYPNYYYGPNRGGVVDYAPTLDAAPGATADPQAPATDSASSNPAHSETETNGNTL